MLEIDASAPYLPRGVTLPTAKLCDFGFARLLTDSVLDPSLSGAQVDLVGGVGRPYTGYVSTRWYRCPELLLPIVAYKRRGDYTHLVHLMYKNLRSGGAQALGEEQRLVETLTRG